MIDQLRYLRNQLPVHLKVKLKAIVESFRDLMDAHGCEAPLGLVELESAVAEPILTNGLVGLLGHSLGGIITEEITRLGA